MRLASTLVAVAAALLLAAPAHAGKPQPPSVGGLLTNGVQDPLGIGGDAPRLSWRLQSGDRGIEQRAYQVRVTSGGRTEWDSGKVDSSRSVEVRYAGPDLRSHTAYEWSVRVWTGRSASAWSRPASFETGLLGPERVDRRLDRRHGDRRRVEGLHGRVHGLGHRGGARRLPARPRHRERLHVADQRERPRAAAAREDRQRLHGAAGHAVPGGLRLRRRAPLPDQRRTARRSRRTWTASCSTHARAPPTASRASSASAPSGAERGVVRDVTVTSAAGDVLVDTDFPAGDRTFSAGTVTDDGLVVGSGDTEAWLAAARRRARAAQGVRRSPAGA